MVVRVMITMHRVIDDNYISKVARITLGGVLAIHFVFAQLGTIG